MPIAVTGSMTPLAASGGYDSGIIRNDPESPNISVTVSADQSGTLYIQEFSQENGDPIPSLSIPIIGGASAAFVTYQVRQPFWKALYINGAMAQATFSLSFVADIPQNTVSQANIMFLILKELRAISMLIANLKEPSGSQVNMDYGPDARNLI